ncbi:hypothetical protein ACJJTC_002100, partial [Scirpophaga incertulas]
GGALPPERSARRVPSAKPGALSAPRSRTWPSESHTRCIAAGRCRPSGPRAAGGALPPERSARRVPSAKPGALSAPRSRTWPSESHTRCIAAGRCRPSGPRAAGGALPPERSARRVPSAKPGALFGAKITHVAKREKRNIPFIISACVREVERRGIHEVGVYRVSGSASDLNRLKKSFETNAYEAEQLLKEVDIHSVTGVLKLYLRELPEALFTDALYPELLRAWGATQGAGASVDSAPAHTRRHALLKCYSQLPDLNKNCIDFLLNHFVK